MPLDLNCPKCQHVFPVTEARHPIGVECPKCDAELTAEFLKLTSPEPGQPPYELLVTAGHPNHAPLPLPGGKKLLADDEKEERGGGSIAVVVFAGLAALLVALGGLGATGYFLFTNLDTSDSTIGTINNNKSNNKGNQPNPRTGPRTDAGPGPGTGPGFTFDPGEQFTPQPKADTFELKPVGGPLPTITPPNLPANPSNIPLPGRVGQLAIGGGGRYLVMHFPDQGKLGVLDATTAQFRAVDADSGDARLAAGLSVAVLCVRGPKITRVYDLPQLRKEYDAPIDSFFGVTSIAMGSRTNGPLLMDTGFGDLRLYNVVGKMTEIEGARGKPGIHSTDNGLRALPDGTAFATFDGTRNGQRTSLLTNFGQKWKVLRDVNQVPFPGGDGNFYGNGVVVNRDGRDQRFGGVGAGSNVWYVPAISGNTHFLKVAPTSVGVPPRDKKTITVTIHANKKAGTPVAGTATFTDLPEFEGFRNIFNTEFHVTLDQHLFLIPEAELLVTLPNSRDRLVLRKIVER